MKCNWEDLPERRNLFTVKNTAMINLNTGKTVQRYSANTKIAVVQKCNSQGKTYYRTFDATYHNLNYAFEAEAFGLPNEKAPSAPSTKSNTSESSFLKKKTDVSHTVNVKKQKASKKVASSKDGGKRRPMRWLKKLFRRKNV